MIMSSQVQSSSAAGPGANAASLQQQISQGQQQQNSFTLAAAATVAVQQQQNQALAAAAVAAAAAAATSGSGVPGGNNSVISSVLNNAGAGGVPGGMPLGPGAGTGGQTMSVEAEKIFQCISDLLNSETRESALMELSRKRESVPDLAIMLWHSFGSIAALLQEIVAVYPTIHPPTLNAHQSNRVCNALALLQCVASHPETRAVFLQANMPLFLYPFLNMNTSSKTRPFEYLRLTSLGVIGALVKTDEKEVINFLLKTEIIPLCLRIMESGTELSKTVATFILQKILLDETGLNYICQTYDRFSHVAMILAKMVIALAKEQSARLLKHVIRCYLRLSDNPRAREALRQCLPDQLRNNTFMACLKDDRTTKNWLIQLLKNIEPKPGETIPGVGPQGGGGQPGQSASSGGGQGQSSPSPSGAMMNSMMASQQQAAQQQQQQQQQQQGIKANKM